MSAIIDLTAFAKETALPPDTGVKAPPMVEFFSPAALREYRPAPGTVMVGNNHIVRGAVFVIGGAPGVGKSRASVALAVAGATGNPWLGLPVHRKFKTLIIQNENGMLRLSEEFSGLPCELMEQWVRVSAPPPFGIAIRHAEFRRLIGEEITRFEPDVVMIDPWNAVSQDDKARDYLETFDLLRGLVPASDKGPALGIVAHTRKPKQDERASGRGLLNLLAGSYTLASVPRAVFVLQPATDAPEDSTVIFTCCKNNDGEMGAPTAWTRCNGLFSPCPDFDWKAYSNQTTPKGRARIGLGDMRETFEQAGGTISRQEAAKILTNSLGCSRSVAYDALNLDGRFSRNLRMLDGKLTWTEDSLQSESEPA